MYLNSHEFQTAQAAYWLEQSPRGTTRRKAPPRIPQTKRRLRRLPRPVRPVVALAK
jgi:hypothetical protein